MNYGAYNDAQGQSIVWFRTSLSMATGFYHRHTLRQEPPDVCIAESVPELIMKVYPWIQEQESAFQQQVGSPGSSDKDKDRISEKMTDRLVQHLDPNDDTVWVDEPHWVNHLRSD
jgi:hypothetical protein